MKDKRCNSHDRSKLKEPNFMTEKQRSSTSMTPLLGVPVEHKSLGLLHIITSFCMFVVAHFIPREINTAKSPSYMVCSEYVDKMCFCTELILGISVGKKYHDPNLSSPVRVDSPCYKGEHIHKQSLGRKFL